MSRLIFALFVVTGLISIALFFAKIKVGEYQIVVIDSSSTTTKLVVAKESLEKLVRIQQAIMAQIVDKYAELKKLRPEIDGEISSREVHEARFAEAQLALYEIELRKVEKELATRQ